MKSENKVINDEIDLISILSVLFDNFNLLISIFLSSLIFISIYYLSAEKIYESKSLLEIKSEKSSFLPESLTGGISGFSNTNSLTAELEIYKSNNTILDAINNLKNSNLIDPEFFPISPKEVRNNLLLSTDSQSLITISFKSPSQELSTYLLDFLNEEFIKDRKNFSKESTAAGRDFVIKEIPRIKLLLEEAETNLNEFKVSTNTSDIIFDTNTRNTKLERLKNRINEIEFKELELKEFYKENHPIYLTLSQQKKLIQTQIQEIEDDLPSVPSTQRRLENFKREVEIYSNVLKELSSQELSLGMSEASSISNVRIINNASKANKIYPTLLMYILAFVITLVAYIYFLASHFFGNKITNLDALMDYVGKENVLGELPFIKDLNVNDDKISHSVAEELLNKITYELTHGENVFKSIAIVGSRKDVGKTEISKQLFEKLRLKHKACLLDLDYRKKGLTKEYSSDNFKNFEEFNQNRENYTFENGSMFIPSFEQESPPSFFSSEEFKKEIESLKKEFEIILCDTPPWQLFVDSKIISKLFDCKLYVVCNQSTSFKDIDLFQKDIENQNSIRFFYNKFNLYFNFLWYKYQYPYYANNYYYDYLDYSGMRKSSIFPSYFDRIALVLRSLYKRFISFIKK